MAARPGRVFADIAVDAPYPRDEDFRTSAAYNDYCRQVSDALHGAIRVGDGRPMTAVEAERHAGARGGAEDAVARAAAAGQPRRARAPHPRPGRDARASSSSAGRSTSPSPRCRTTSCRARCRIAQALVTDWADPAAGAAGHAQHHLLGAGPGAGRRRRARDPPGRSRAGSSSRFFPYRGHPAGDADRRHRAADPDLRARHPDGAADLRLPRRLLPDPRPTRRRG